MERGRIQGLSIFWVPLIISGTGKAMDFKFGEYMYRANSNRSPLKILEKRERGPIQGLPIFWVPLLSQERVKLYGLQILQEHSWGRSEQKPMKNFGNSSRGRS